MSTIYKQNQEQKCHHLPVVYLHPQGKQSTSWIWKSLLATQWRSQLFDFTVPQFPHLLKGIMTLSTCYGLNGLNGSVPASHPKVTCWNSNAKGKSVLRWDIWGWLGHGGGVLIMGGVQTQLLPPSTWRGHSRKAQAMNRKRVFIQTWLDWQLHLSLSGLLNWGQNIFIPYKSFILWCFVTAAKSTKTYLKNHDKPVSKSWVWLSTWYLYKYVLQLLIYCKINSNYCHYYYFYNFLFKIITIIGEDILTN